MAGGSARTSIEPYLRALQGSPGTDPHLVGVVAAVNGRAAAADVFGDPALFRKLWPRLLRAYAADAAEAADARPVKATFTAAQARAFLAQASDGRVRSEGVSPGVRTLRLQTKDTILYRAAPMGLPGVAGGMGGAPLHTNVLRR